MSNIEQSGVVQTSQGPVAYQTAKKWYLSKTLLLAFAGIAVEFVTGLREFFQEGKLSWHAVALVAMNTTISFFKLRAPEIITGLRFFDKQKDAN